MARKVTVGSLQQLVNRPRASTTPRGAAFQQTALARAGYKTSKSSRTPRARRSRSRRAMRRGRQPNLRRLRRELSDLPRFSSFIQRREERMQAQLRAIPGDILRTVYMGSGIPNLLQPYNQLMDWYRFFAGLDQAWFGKQDREDEEEEEEEEEESSEEQEPKVIIIYRDREEQETTTQIGDTFGKHQKLLFGHIDKIISLLQGLNEKPYRRDVVAATVIPLPGSRARPQEEEDNLQSTLATLLAGISGALIGMLNSGPIGNGPGSMLSGLTRVGQVAVGALAGNAMGRFVRDAWRERASDQRRERRQTRRDQNRHNRNARNIRSQQSGARTRTSQPSRLRSLMRQVRRTGATISRTVGGMSRGTVALLRTLRRIVRIGGVAGFLAIPILEWFERSEQMRQIQQNPDLTDREREVAEAQVWVEGIADVLAVGGGAAIGGLAVMIPLIGPFVGLITSGIGAWLGQMGADWFNRNYADDVARFLVDSNATDAIQSFVDGMVNLPSTFLSLLETGIRTNPILFAPLLPLLPMLREQRERSQAQRVRLPPEPPEATPTPPQQVAEPPPQLEITPEEQRTLTVAEQRIQDTNVEAEPEEHDHAHEISTPTRRSSQAVIVREIHTLIYKSNKLVLAK